MLQIHHLHVMHYQNETVLPSGKRAKNARIISLPSFWQNYFVTMLTSLDKLQKTLQIHQAYTLACIALNFTQDLGASCVAFVALHALRVKISRNACNARNEHALNYTQGPWLRCLRCVRCVTLETGLKRKITHMMPHTSPGNLVFCCQKSLRNSNGITPYGSDKCRWGGLKLSQIGCRRLLVNRGLVLFLTISNMLACNIVNVLERVRG